MDFHRPELVTTSRCLLGSDLRRGYASGHSKSPQRGTAGSCSTPPGTERGKPHLFELLQIDNAFVAADILRRFATITGLARLYDLLDEIRLTSLVEDLLRRTPGPTGKGMLSPGRRATSRHGIM